MRGWGLGVWLGCLVAAVMVVVGVGVVWVVPGAGAVGAGVGWEAFAQAFPSFLHPGDKGRIQVDVMNTGAARSSGPVTVVDRLPRGLRVLAAGGVIGDEVSVAKEVAEFKGKRWGCSWSEVEEEATVVCVSDPVFLGGLPTGQGKQGFKLVERVGVEVEVEEGAMEGSFPDRVTVSGGGAVGATSVSDRLVVSAGEPGFGFSNWDVWFSNADGSVDTQAGSHPYETTFAVGFNELPDGKPAGGEPRVIEAELPPGFFGEPNVVPRCTRALLDAEACPADTVVGDDLAMLAVEGGGGPDEGSLLPVYNMAPPEGVAAEFAFKIQGKPGYFDAGPRGFGNYGIVVHINNVPAVGVTQNIVTLWGVPPEASHDAGRIAFGEVPPENKECKANGCPSNAPARPFLTLPTSCGAPQEFKIRALGTWEDPQARSELASTVQSALGMPTGFKGCSALAFDPSLSIAPETGEADTPTGLGVDVTMPQETLRVPGQLVESTIKNTTVTLPEGFVINPGQAAGLQACAETQAKLGEEGVPGCPNASKVGKVKIKTPLLEGELESELEGSVYVLSQYEGRPGEKPRGTLQSNPPALQLLLAISGDGINLKLVANVQLNETTGQLSTTLTETPGLPVTSVEVSFSGGAQAALATPVACGLYTATSDFTPWTSPFGADLFPSSSFQITGGPGGGGCLPSALPFSPMLTAGSTTDQAGGYTGFSLLLQRGDGQQRIERLQLEMPEGLSGAIGAVEQCPEPQAREGECGSASQIGSATVASGPGPFPLVIPQPGEPESAVYLTGPYEGAPFGLSIVTHVIAGPFDLEKGTPCDCIVTRARVEVDPLTAQIVITTQPLPQIVDGVPTDLRLVNSVVDKPDFLFNPTSCKPTAITGTAWGTPPPGVPGAKATAPIQSRTQVGSCQSLDFEPKLKVTASSHTSRLRGAAVSFKLSMPDELGKGTEANIKRVKVSLPKQLPSPLKTLQKACTEKVFAEDPAHCPEASQVAEAKVTTPVLPGGLSGPAYFVSHGSAKYPELILVLTGENGITVQVHAETFISKKGITTGTFSAVPDVPFTTAELSFPQREFPAFTSDGSLCKHPLDMPTEYLAQNALALHHTTIITVTGCPKKSHGKHHGKRRHTTQRTHRSHRK